MRLRLISVFFALMLLPLAATAQINGDFETGGLGWTVVSPGGFWEVLFPPAGGNPNGYAQIHSPFGNSGGQAHIEQTFVCGDSTQQGNCLITFDWQCQNWDAAPGTGRILVIANGVVLLARQCDETQQPFRTEAVTVPCGVVRLQLCLQVDAGNNGWQACFDNVRADCGTVPTKTSTWGAIKDLYE